MQPVRVRLQAEVELTFEEEDLAAPKVRGVTPKRIVPAGRLQGQITFDGATPTPEYKQLGTIVEKLAGGPHPRPPSEAAQWSALTCCAPI